MVNRWIFSSLIFLFFFSPSFAKSENFPATYQTEKWVLSTFSQLKNRFSTEHPYLKNQYIKLPELEWGGKNYNGLSIQSEGAHKGTKYIQNLRYIELHPGLWKLAYVDNQECLRGEALREDEWITVWGCKQTEAPLSGAFADLFFVDDNVNTTELSLAWGQNVSLYIPLENRPQQPEQSAIKTLGDIKKIVTAFNTSWQTQDTFWTGLPGFPVTPQKALKIFVSGQLDETYRIEQSFLYLKHQETLKLKAIDGVICHFSNSLNKDICNPIHRQTSITPFPLNLIDSTDETPNLESPEASRNSNSPLLEKENFLSCGNISQNFEMILRFHFESSIFDFNDIKKYRGAFASLPLVADPLNLVLTEKDTAFFTKAKQAPFHNDLIVSAFMEEINKGKDGNCSLMAPLIEQLKTRFTEENESLQTLLNILSLHDFNFETITALSSDFTASQKKWWRLIEVKTNTDFSFLDRPQALDIAANQLNLYVNKATALLSNYEKTITAAFAKQDTYSHLFEIDKSITNSIDGVAKDLYFGLSIQMGYSGRHYVSQVHPSISKKYNIFPGDSIFEINNQPAIELTPLEVDKILLDTSRPIRFLLKNNNSETSFTLKAQPFDFMEFFYSLELVKTKNKNFLKINLTSFEAGLTRSLYNAINEALSVNSIDGFILNLQGNRGGYMPGATKTISLFVKERTVSYYHRGARGRGLGQAILAEAPYFISDSLPLVVQVDNQTASAAEVVASSLQSLNRSVTVGSQTFGKLVGQEYNQIKMSDGHEMAMVISSFEFFTAEGISLNGKGVSPDIQYGQVSTKDKFNDGNRPGINMNFESVELQAYPDSLTRISHEVKTSEFNHIDELSSSILESIQNARLIPSSAKPLLQ